MTANDRLRALVAEATGINFWSLDHAAFSRSVDAQLVRRGFASRYEYAAALRDSPDELQSLVEELVVPETWFFRDQAPFRYLEEWARKTSCGFLRVLSAPCSTGEEAYSIAIALLEAGLTPERFLIDAVDISQRALETARRAVYRKSSFRESWGRCQNYFTTVENGYALSDEITRLVQFRRDNLVSPSFLREQRPFQVIFCRNLLIYLGAEARQAVLNNVSRLVVPDGLVVVGASELPAFLQNGYTAVSHARSFACRKTPPAAVPTQPPPAALPFQMETAVRSAGTDCGPSEEASLDGAWRLADEGALDRAMEVCDSLLARGPARLEHYYLKGLLSEALNQLDEAEDLFRKVLYLDPDHYPALLHMGALCERRGERSRGELFRARAKRTAERGVELCELHR